MPRPNYESEKMSLEDYLQFILSRSTLHLTVSHLNQIISMHGFKKLHRIHKKIMSQAVNTLELMEPSRSTLRDYISPPTAVNDENVVADMDALGWTDCHVSNVMTLSSFHRQNDAVNNNNNRVRLDFVEKSQVPAEKLVQRRRRRTAVTKEIGDGVDDMAAKKWKSLNNVSVDSFSVR